MAAPWREFRLRVRDQYGDMAPYTVGVPVEWTLLTEMRDELQRAVLVRDELCEYDDELKSWVALLFLLWERDGVELSARWSHPNAEHRIIDYPISERIFGYYDQINNRLYHRTKGQVFYDVKMRAKPTPTAVRAVLEAPASATSETAETAGMTVQQRREQLILEVCRKHSYGPDTSPLVVFRRAQVDYRNLANSPILRIKRTAIYKFWQGFKANLPVSTK
jgi:hypothetical protein